jgi:hypothetical protein
MAERLSGCLQRGLCEFEMPVQMRVRWQGTKRPYAAQLGAWSVPRNAKVGKVPQGTKATFRQVFTSILQLSLGRILPEQ